MMRYPLCIAAVVLSPPTEASAHSVERGLIQLLPTGHYVVGAALTVAATFLLLALRSGERASETAMDPPPDSPEDGSGSLVGRALQVAAFGVFCLLVLIGAAGPRDPLENLAPLVVWTVFWIGFPVLVAIFGDPWRWCNPWSAPVRALGGGAGRRLPGWLGYWPATVSLGAVIWYDLVYPAPRDPGHLAWALAGYWALHLAAMLTFGDAAWRQKGEAFSVLFRLLGRLSPLCGRSVRGLSAARPLPLSGWMFVMAAIAAITADGAMGTFRWLGAIGVNPLEYPGRSALIGVNSVALLGVWVALSSVYVLAVYAGLRLAGHRGLLGEALGRFAFSLLPIALAYHLAHYLTHAMVNGQYVLVALSDPLQTGGDWLGLGDHFVSTAFLNGLESVQMLWRVQVGIILAGHLVAVLIADRVAVRMVGPRATLAGLPLALLMVGMTVLGLWLLSAPRTG